MKKRLFCLIFVFVMIFTVACSSAPAPAPASPAPANPAPANPAPANPANPAPGGPSGEILGPQDDWVKLNLVHATYLPEMNPAVALTKHWERTLEEYMPGYITIETYANGTLLSQSDIMEGVRLGTADIVFLPIDYYARHFPLSRLWSYPGVQLANNTAGSAAFTEWAHLRQPPEFDEYIFLYAQNNGPGSIMTTFPVTDPSDFIGKQFYATGGSAEIMKAFGAIPVSMEISELSEAVRSGLVAGAYLSLTVSTQYGITDYCNYVTQMDMSSTTFAYLMNKNTFNRMPESQQQAFLQAMLKACYEGHVPQARTVLTLSSGAVEILAGGSLEFNLLDHNTMERFNDVSMYLTEEYLEELAAMGYDAQAEFDLIVQIAQKWADWYPFDLFYETHVVAATEGTEGWEKFRAEIWDKPLPPWPENSIYTPSSPQAYLWERP